VPDTSAPAQDQLATTDAAETVTPSRQQEPVAIIGVGLRFPGGNSTLVGVHPDR
jgi:hypothetical protein